MKNFNFTQFISTLVNSIFNTGHVELLQVGNIQSSTQNRIIQETNTSGFLSKMIFFLAMMFLLVGNQMSFGQINIAPGGTITETFSIGTSATATLPTGWKIQALGTVRTAGTYAGAVSATANTAGGGGTISASGIWNFGAGSNNLGTDRAIGGLHASASNRTINVYAQLTNNGATAIPSFTISYNVEKYRNGSLVVNETVQMYYSTDGSTWTTAGSNFLTSIAPDANINVPATAPSSSTSISSQTLAQSVNAASSIYLMWQISPISGTSGANSQALAIDDVTITAGGVPSIAISGVDPGASSVTVGTSNVVLQQYNLAVTTAATNLTGLNVTTAGTYATADITNLKVRYSTDAVLDGADATLSTLTSPGAAGSLTFPSFTSQAISSGTTGYIFITADVAAGATGGNTINIASNAFTNFTFSSGTKTGTDPVAAAGVKTFSSLVSSIAISNSAPASSNQNAGTTNVVLQRLDLAVTVTSTSLTGLTVTTAGSYASADITNLKVRYSTDATLDGADATLSTFTTPGVAGSKVFPSFTTQALASGATYYLFITADIAASATGGNTISLGSTAFSNISFSSGTKTGTDPVAASNTVTIVNPAIAVTSSSPAASSHLQGSTNVVLNRFDFAVTSSNATLTGITVTTAGTYAAADLVNLKCWYQTTTTFNSGTATLLSTKTTSLTAGAQVFPSFTSQVITSGTAGYIFITADISSTATSGNTISLASTAFSNLTFSLGNLTGTNPVAAGNARTFIKAEPTNYPSSFACGTTTSTSIPLTWTDASAGVTPDGYLIQWSNTGYGSITPPADGTAITDLASAVLGAKNIAQGVGLYTIPSLSSLTTYYIRIWSYTNSGSNINYKLVSEPQTSCATLIAPVSILTFEFAGIAGNEVSAASNFNNPNLTNSLITRGSGLTASGNADRFNATNWALTSIANAVSTNNYMEFTITPSVGYQFNVSSITLSLQRSLTGASAIALRNSLDSYSSNLDAVYSIVDNALTQTFTFTFTQINSTSAVTYRVYMYAEATTGTAGIGDFTGNDIDVFGNVSSLGTITTGTVSTSLCAGATGVSVPFTYTPSVNFPSGTATFTAQLSDAAGSFATPVTLQSVTSNGSGSQSISATIPALTTTGTGYRIRVVSASPGVNGSDNASNISISNTATSIAPSTTQNISTSTNGTTLTVTEATTASTRVWKYGTVSGVYGTSTGITTSTYTPNFVLPDTYYIVCETTYPAPCSNVVTSNEVQVNVVGSVDYTWNGSVSSNWSNSSNWTPNGVPIVDDNVTIDVPGSNTLIVTDARSINSLTLSGTGTFQLTSSGALSVNGNISNSIAGSPSFDCASSFSILSTSSQTIPSWNFGNLTASGGARVLSSTGTIGICGTFTPGAGAYTNTGSTINFNGTGAQTVNALSYNNLTISGAHSTNNVTLAAGTIGVSGTFSPTATFSTGAYSNTGNTIDYNATGAQTIAAFPSYNNLTISGARASATVTLASGTIGVAGTFNPSATAVTYTSTGNTFNYTSAGSQTIAVFSQYNNLSNSGNGARTLANGIIAIYGTYTPTSAAITVGTSTVDFAGVAGQTIPASFYNNITNSSNTDRTWANAGIIDIKNTFTPTSATNTITGSTIQYSATTPGQLLTTFTTNVVSRNYNNLIFNGTGGNWSLNGNTIGVANDLTVSAGTLLIGSSAGAATLNIDGNLTIATGAVFNATNSTTLSGSINLSGNFSNAGILQKSASIGTSVFTFNKTSGTQTFSNTGTISNNLGFNIGSGSTANTLQLLSNIAGSSSTYIIATGSTIDFQTFILTGSGAFTSNSGSSIITANVIGTGAITNTGANGSIQTLGTRIYNATTNFTFNGASAQNTGNGFALANNVTINNAFGVTLTSAATVNGVLTFTSGILDIAAVNLTIGVSGSITGVNTTKYVKTSSTGQLKMTIAASNVLFPVGRSAYNPLTLNNSGTSDVFGVVLADAISQSLNNAAFVVNRSWNITENIAGGSNLSIVTQWNGAGEEAASFAGGTTRRIAYWNGSAWVQTGAVQAGANPYTFSSSANLTGIASATYSIAMGKDDAFICTTAPTVTLILPISGYSGDVITINGTGLTGLTSATVGGTAATILSQSGASATLSVGAGSTGVITVSKSAVCSASGSQTFTFNGYISAQSGNWSLGSTWQGGVVPSDLVAVTIASSHIVTVDDLTNPTSVVINAGGELTGTDDAQQLFVGSTGNGPVSVSGTLSLGTSLVSNGWLVCGTLSVNNGGIFNNNCGNAIAAGLNVTSLTLASGATYNHNALGSTLNGTLSDFPGLTGGTNISINSNANVNITKWAQNTGTPSSLPSVFGGQWGNLTVNISGLTYSGSWQNSGILTNATSLNIVNTGTRDFRLVTPTGVSGFTCNIGSVNVSGGIFVLIGGGSTGSGVVTMNVTNDFNVSGGVASIHGSSVTQSYNTTGVTLNVGGNLNITGGSFYGHANSLNNTAAASSSATTLNVTGNLSINNATLNLAFFPNYNFAGNTGNVNLNLKGNLTIGATGILRNSNSIAPLGKTTATVNFNHASAQQTWTQTGAIQDVIGFNVNGTANKLQLLSDANIGTSTTSSFNVANATTFDMQAFVLGGSGTFTSVAGSTLKLGNANGITTIPTLLGNVQLLASRTFNDANNYTYSGSVNQVTGNGLPSTLTGALSISNTGAALNNVVTLTTTGTTASTLNLTSGLFAAGAAGQLNISAAGTVNGTGGDFETGANAGILNFPGTGSFTGNSNPYNVYTSDAVNFGAGTVTIQPAGTFRINTGGSVITNAPFYSSTSTLNYNTTGNYGRGLEWSNSIGRGYPHHVKVSNSTTFQPGGNSNQNTVLDMAGDLTIDAGSTMNLNAIGLVMNTNFNVLGSLSLNGTLSLSSIASKDLYIGGDWTRSGVFNHNDRKVVFNRQTAGNQTLTVSSGVLETFYDLEVFLVSGKLVTASSTGLTILNNLNFASGKIDIGANQLTIGTASTNGTITGASSSNYVITNAIAGGGNIKAFTNTNAIYNFPVGDATSYTPMTVTFTDGPQAGAYITTTAVNDIHPNLFTASPPTKYISRYWSVEPSFLESNPVYNVSFSYVAADEVGVGTLYPIKYSTTTPGWLSCPGSPAAAITGTSGSNNAGSRTFSWDGLTTFSDFTGAGDGSPLPVTWLNFDAQFNNTSNNVDVTWTTASEINNDYFEILRSNDAVNFNVIGKVDGAGNSSLVKDYTFEDSNPLTGISYYKIRQVDFNGLSDNTEIRAVSNTGGVSTGTLFAYPNPLIGQDLTVVYSNLDKGNWEYRLVDITGKIVLAQNRTSDSNAGAFTLNLEQLPAGIYLFQLNTQSQNFIRKITISK